MSDRLIRVVANYEARLRTGANGRLSERDIRRRVANYGVAAAIADVELDQVRQVLCSHGIATISFPFYHAFSRELSKLTRQDISRERMQHEMVVLAAKWVRRGLSQRALLDIALTVYNLPTLQPPGE